MFLKTYLLCLSIISLTTFMHELWYERYHGNTLIKYLRTGYKGEFMKKMVFNNYLRRFNKSYGKEEFDRRFFYFKTSLKQIKKLNHGSHATFGLTKFSDWSEDERSKLLTNNVGACDTRAMECPPGVGGYKNRYIRKRKILPRKDWRETGAVGSVLDQKVCSACWAFSIVGVMESMAFIRYNRFIRLSIQQLIDCSYDSKGEKTGCGRGRPVVEALRFLCETQMSVATEASYPLSFADTPFQQCSVRPSGIEKVRSFRNSCNMYKNETKLLEALNFGPVTALVNADYFFNYLEGIITRNCDCTEDQLNHAVQIVGYDVSDGILHYIVRNSWGRSWGEGGFVRLAVGGNQCGVAYSIGALDVY